MHTLYHRRYTRSVFRRLLTAWRIYKLGVADKRTPFLAKALPWLSVLYLISPIDLIPDILPILGQIDDVGVIALFFLWALRMIPNDVKKKAERAEVIDVEAE